MIEREIGKQSRERERTWLGKEIKYLVWSLYLCMRSRGAYIISI